MSDIDHPICPKCGQYKRRNDARCSLCRVLAKYGIALDQFFELWEQQEGKCAICGYRPSGWWPDVLCVDHDHHPKFERVSFHIRGLLCQQCNKGLGCFADDVERMESAIQYLQKRAQITVNSTQSIRHYHQSEERQEILAGIEKGQETEFQRMCNFIDQINALNFKGGPTSG